MKKRDSRQAAGTRPARDEIETALFEAANEIERLRAEKIELLKKRNAEEMQKMIDYWGHRAEKAEDEIERLRREVEEWKCRVNEGADIIAGNVAIIDELRAANKRLQDALIEVAEL